MDRAGPGGHGARVLRGQAAGTAEVSSRGCRMAVGPSRVRSTRFTVSLEGDRLVIRGGGWGHGVGLCQMGARGMAIEGKSGEEILHHYYPGATLARLNEAAR